MKVVYLSPSKMGTTTFATIFDILGFKVMENDYSLTKMYREGNLESIWNVFNKYDAFVNFPWCLMYKEIDEYCDDCKFILSVRPFRSWWRSILYHTLRPITVERRRKVLTILMDEYNIRKYTPFAMKEFREFYDNHVNNIRNYFKDKDNFLEVPWVGEKNSLGDIMRFLGRYEDLEDMPIRKNAWPYPSFSRLLNAAIHNPIEFYGVDLNEEMS